MGLASLKDVKLDEASILSRRCSDEGLWFFVTGSRAVLAGRD